MGDIREKKAALVKQIAIHLSLLLGEEWEPATKKDWCRSMVINENGARIFIRTDGDGDRLRVTGEYPGDHLPWGTDKPYITIAARRGADAIAKNIQRRFLPQYLPMFEKNMVMKVADERFQAQEEAAHESLREILGADRVFDGSIRFTGPGDSRGSMSISGGSVTLELRSLSFECARSVACSLVADRDKALAIQTERDSHT